ncbi:MAG: hypothetical protein JRN08_08310 [Nitrososphaerota archaeon]|nr:hypothetical protein [Nitrososphaerota archaeon]
MEFVNGRAPKHGRRSKLDIVGDVLRAIASGAEKPTNVMFRANLTWPLTLAYLELLLRHKMLTTVQSNGRMTYRVTPKGTDLLRSFIEMEEGAAELELDRFDSAILSKVSAGRGERGRPGEPAPIRVIREEMEKEGYEVSEPKIRGLSGVDHAFDLVMSHQSGQNVGYMLVETAGMGDVIRAFILQTDCELQVHVVSKEAPEPEAAELAKTYGVVLHSGDGASD